MCSETAENKALFGRQVSFCIKGPMLCNHAEAPQFYMLCDSANYSHKLVLRISKIWDI